MTGCFIWLVLLVFGLVTLLRWFEEATEAVERGWWNKPLVLIAMPFAVWLFPSRVSAGRPSAVPRHEPVRGFGVVSEPDKSAARANDRPPPGTPKEFIGLPTIPPRKAPGAKPGVDPE